MTRQSVHESEQARGGPDRGGSAVRSGPGEFPQRRQATSPAAPRPATARAIHEAQVIPLDQISVDAEDESLRGDDDGPEFEALVEQIRLDPRGIHQPIEVRERATSDAAFAPQAGPRFRLVTGRRRFRAAERLGHATIRVLNLGVLSDAEVRRIQASENEHRQGTAAINLAYSMAKMQAEGAPIEEIMRVHNKSQAAVYRYLRIANVFGALAGDIRRKLKPVSARQLYQCTLGEHGTDATPAEALAKAWDALADADTQARLDAIAERAGTTAPRGEGDRASRNRPEGTQKVPQSSVHIVDRPSEGRCVIRISLDVERLAWDEQERRHLVRKHLAAIRGLIKEYVAKAEGRAGGTARYRPTDARPVPRRGVAEPPLERPRSPEPTHPLARPAAPDALPPASQTHRTGDGKLLSLGRDPSISDEEIDRGFE